MTVIWEGKGRKGENGSGKEKPMPEPMPEPLGGYLRAIQYASHMHAHAQIQVQPPH